MGESVDRPGRLDAWQARQRATTVRRSSRPPRPGRTRPIAAGILVAALAAGWLAVSRRAAPAAVAPPVERATTAPAASPRPASLRARLPRGLACTDVSGADARVECSVDRVQLEIALLGEGADAAYRRVTGARERAVTGPPACAHGRPDERSWSRAAAPGVPVGRYRCTFEHGVAAMWWTDNGLLVHAVAPVADLERLFTWWRTHPIA